MFYLISVILLTTAIIILFRYFDKFRIDITQAIVTNYLLASALGFMQTDGLVPADIPGKEWFIYSITAGITLTLAFYLYAYSSLRAGVAITAVSGKMSVVIPVGAGILLYGESTGLIKTAGISAALIAFYLTFRKEGKNKISDSKYFLLPVMLFMVNGMNDTLIKHAEKNCIHGETMAFLSTTFMFSFFAGMVVLIISALAGKQKINMRSIVAGIILGLINWGSTLGFLKAIGVYESTVFFPVYNVSVVAILALTGYFIFREKLTKINWIGIILAAASIILITVAA